MARTGFSVEFRRSLCHPRIDQEEIFTIVPAYVLMEENIVKQDLR